MPHKILPLTSSEFDHLIAPFVRDGLVSGTVCVAVSGGADSLALLYLVSRYAQEHGGPDILAVTVDHGLRVTSADETKQVAAWVRDWPHVTHKTLVWRGAKPTTKISETAREKRYALIEQACGQAGIRTVFVAHHMNDQAETVLLRLSAGSGVDGLSGMAAVQDMGAIKLVRPLLSISHDRLCATLSAAGQEWVEDPTNKNTDYARPRLRAAVDVLGTEGLTPERLGVLGMRAARARDVLERVADEAWDTHAQVTHGSVAFLCDAWGGLAVDTRVRMMMRGIAHVAGKPPRLEQIERLLDGMDASATAVFRATLGHACVTRGKKWVKITAE